MAWRTRWVGLLAVGLLLAGCGKLVLPWQKKDFKSTPQPEITEPAPAPKELMSTLLPVGPIEWQATFDDGTPNLTEAVLPSSGAVVGTQGGTPYVTWHLQPDGIYRKDGKSGALLRYLPAELEDGLAWTQESGGERHWFLLTKCGAEECWEVQMLTRDLVQRFTWAPGRWIIRAESIDLANPKNSYHKVLKGEPAPSKQVAAPEVWADGKAPSVTPSTPEQFAAEHQKRLAAHAPKQ